MLHSLIVYKPVLRYSIYWVVFLIEQPVSPQINRNSKIILGRFVQIFFNVINIFTLLLLMTWFVIANDCSSCNYPATYIHVYSFHFII